MNRNDLHTILRTATLTCVAAGTLTCLGALLQTREAVAEVGSGMLAAPAVATPSLTTSNGLLVTARTKATELKSGEKPALLLTIENPTAEAKSVSLTAALTGSRVSDMVSRRPPVAVEFWRQACPVQLAAREKKTLELTAIAMPAGAYGRFTVYDGIAPKTITQSPELLSLVPVTPSK